LFERVYERDINGLERDVALYLDDADAIKWWHRLVARQDYGLQGWPRNKVFPDFFVMIRRDGDTCTLTALETKGAHLIGNDDTAYKQRLFDLLTSHIAKAQEAGQVLLTREGQPMTFKLMLDQTWQPEIQALLAA
jgi:type III restriction enzyme